MSGQNLSSILFLKQDPKTSETEDNSVVNDYQNGFRQKRSTIDHLTTLTIVIESRKAEHKPTCVAFIDLKKHNIILIETFCGISSDIWEFLVNFMRVLDQYIKILKVVLNYSICYPTRFQLRHV